MEDRESLLASAEEKLREAQEIVKKVMRDHGETLVLRRVFSANAHNVEQLRKEFDFNKVLKQKQNEDRSRHH